MYWADKVASEIIKSGKHKPYHIDDMFTPSGFAHVGSLRGPLVHDLIYKALKTQNIEVEFTFVFNDFDPIDGLSPELTEKFSQHLGVPLRKAPSPEPGFESFGEYFADDFKKVLATLDVKPRFLSSWDLYREGKFNDVIRVALDNAEKIQDIYQKVSGSKKREQEWLPFQVICENCGRIGTTKVYEWDGKTVKYRCEPELVKWAKGCGHTGEISPFDGNGKLPWKVDWPAHWVVLGVTIEGEGKDHASAGGSRDIANSLCEEVFKYTLPFDLPYEFFLIGGKKMASSKGLGLKAREFVELLPSEVGRFLFERTDYRSAIEFNPVRTWAIPDLFDEYDRSQKDIFLPRFRDVANYVQLPDVEIQKKFEEIKGSSLTDEEKEILKKRAEYAQKWLEGYAPEDAKFEMAEFLPESAKNLNDKQKDFLDKVAGLVEKTSNPDDLQVNLYNLASEVGISTKDAFSAIYLVFLGKEHGPRAAWFLLQYPKEKVVKRIEEASM